MKMDRDRDDFTEGQPVEPSPLATTVAQESMAHQAGKNSRQNSSTSQNSSFKLIGWF